MEYKQVISPGCRSCKHTKDFHYPNYGLPNIPPLPCKGPYCKCKEYLPVDNLEYLEYMNEFSSK